MSCWTKEELENMLEDVVNELNLSEIMIEKHDPLGTSPAKLVRLVLEQKDMQIKMLKAGMVQIDTSKKITMTNDKIQKGDFIIDTEKIGISINDENIGNVVKCKEILNDNDLVWESIDGKSSACDSIFQFKKVINE